jgi:GTPase SAR1 family protein
MGSIISSVWNKLFKSQNNFKILILGLANAGKTTILYQMYPIFYHSGILVKLFKHNLLLDVTFKKLSTKMSSFRCGM